MKSFFIMLGFFTRLPVPKVEFTEERFRKAIILSPLGGLVIGAILMFISFLIFRIHATDIVRGALLTCVYIFLTGGLHFDGLADTCDGIFSGRTREKSLEIMKDSRIGVFGMLGLFMAGLLYFAMLTIASPVTMLIFPVIGRACCLISASIAPYARDGGIGKAADMKGSPAPVIAAIISLIVGSLLVSAPFLDALSGYAGGVLHFSLIISGRILLCICSVAAAGAAVLITVLLTLHLRKKLGGVTGDTFGAVIEISSIAYILVFTLFYPVLPI